MTVVHDVLPNFSFGLDLLRHTRGCVSDGKLVFFDWASDICYTLLLPVGIK